MHQTASCRACPTRDPQAFPEAADSAGGEGVVPGGERPILQLVYTVKGYDDAGSNYGFFQLFPD